MIPNFIRIDNQTYFADIQIGMNKVLIRYSYNISSEGEDLQQACNRMVALLQAKGFIPKENKEIRNAQQNRLYHKWLSIIAESSGNTSEALHELMKKKFLSKRKRVKINGKSSYVNIAGSTTKLSVKTFTEYLDNVYTFFSDNGYVLPLMDQLEADSLLSSYNQ